ncbi:hypothetical protein [Pelagibius sp. Alg239-R121]|uniref:hypothetical protein n=1 Tax=Pelagibius sp. Alg239-R121 TaxID=2993448 RepID=UPI0024A722DD|nr:hypothetical protein [Pelagibius sp. Alg239-R121]
MTLPTYATYLIVPLHLIAGFLFGLIPSSVYHPAYYGAYSGIVLTLVVTVVVYGMLVQHQQPGFVVVWLQCFLALLAVAIPFFTLDFSDLWHALMYPLIMGGSLVACLVVAHIVLLTTRV